MSDDETKWFFHLDVASTQHSKSVTNLGAEELLSKYAVPHQMNAVYRVDG
jgi:hypothetical protein